MKKAIAFVIVAVFGLSTMACDGANAVPANNVTTSYSKITASGYTAQHINLYGDEVAAALQQAMSNNGFVNAVGSGIVYYADATWSDDKSFVTICVRGDDVRISTKTDRVLPAACVNVSSKDTGVENAIGVALLPKAAEILSVTLKSQIEGKAMPNPSVQTQSGPAKQPVKPETATNSGTAANSKK